MPKKKLLYFILLVFTLTLLHSVFFYYYYSKINLIFSAATVFFIFLFLLNFILVIHVLRNIYLKIIALISFSIFTLYSLINFAYYDVFRVFWKISFLQLGQLDQSRLRLLESYYDLIPPTIYISAASLFLLTSLGLGFYLWQNRAVDRELKRLTARIDFLMNSRKAKPTPVALLGLTIIGVNIVALVFLVNYQTQVGAKNFKRSQYYADLGVYGFLLDNLSSGLKQAAASFGQKPAVASLDDLASLKNDLQSLAILSSTEAKTGVALKSKLDKPHIIIYQMESVDAWALKQDPSPMPFLSKLIKENISAGHFFSNSCITVNAEFAANCSFYPESSGPISDLFAHNNYYCLPTILKAKYGYTTSLFHANEVSFWNRGVLAPKWGFTNLYFSPLYVVRASDNKVLTDVVEKIKNSQGPTYNYVIGFTTHGPHDQNLIDLNRNRNGLNIQPYSYPLSANSLKAEADPQMIRNYFGFLATADEALKNLFDRLAANKLLDKTIVIVYGDHRYYPFSSDNEVEDFYNYNEIPFAMYIPGAYQGKIKEIASQLDIAPTLLNILGGDNYELPPYFLGTSLFSDKHPNSAISKCLGEGSYVSQDLIIRNEKSLGVSQPLVFNSKSAELKYEDYIKYFSEAIKKSDQIIVNDEISSIYLNRSLQTTSSLPRVKEIDLDQTTDSDRDGLSDLREKAIGTDPHNPDTDGDGHLDGAEVINGFNPLGSGFYQE